MHPSNLPAFKVHSILARWAWMFHPQRAGRRQALPALFLAAFCLLPTAYCFSQESARGKAEVWGSLQVSVIDHDTGKSTPARCYLTDPTDQFWSPGGAINYVKPPERNDGSRRPPLNAPIPPRGRWPLWDRGRG